MDHLKTGLVYRNLRVVGKGVRDCWPLPVDVARLLHYLYFRQSRGSVSASRAVVRNLLSQKKQIVPRSTQLKKNRFLVQRFHWNFCNQDSQNGRELMQEVSLMPWTSAIASKLFVIPTAVKRARAVISA